LVDAIQGHIESEQAGGGQRQMGRDFAEFNPAV